MSNTKSRPSGVRLLIGSTAIFFAALIALDALAARGVVAQVTSGRPADGFAGTPEGNPRGMDDYVQKIDFGAGSDPSGIFEGDLPCAMPAKCGGKTAVRVRIVPSNFATASDWDKALHAGGNGYIVAKVTNLEGVPFDRLNLGPYEVGYVWVGESLGLGRLPALYAVRAGTVKRIFRFKGQTFCRDSTPQKPAVHINTPSKCSDPSSSPAAATMQQASIEPFAAIASYLVKTARRMLAPPPVDSGLWISCSVGCCEVQF